MKKVLNFSSSSHQISHFYKLEKKLHFCRTHVTCRTLLTLYTKHALPGLRQGQYLSCKISTITLSHMSVPLMLQPCSTSPAHSPAHSKGRYLLIANQFYMEHVLAQSTETKLCSAAVINHFQCDLSDRTVFLND